MAPSLLLALGDMEPIRRFARWDSFTHWWQPALLVAVCIVLVAFVVTMYIRDCVELGGFWAVLLGSLRIVALAGILFVYLKPEKRDEEKIDHNSRVLVMVDTSRSMGPDKDGRFNHLRKVAEKLSEGGFLDKLREKHDVLVVSFDEENKPYDLLKKFTSGESPENSQNSTSSEDDIDQKQIDWIKTLEARLKLQIETGGNTRFGQSLRKLIIDQRSHPISAIIVFTDGRNNEGAPPQSAIAMARDADIRIYPVGMGSEKLAKNVSITIDTPPTSVYPGEPFPITALVQARDLGGRIVTVELWSSDEKDTKVPAAGSGKLESRQRVTLGGDDKVTPVKMIVTANKLGSRVFIVRVDSPLEDSFPEDNQSRPFTIKVIDEKRRVLLIAGGPTREYRFLRDQLKRDQQFSVDVLLQSARQNISQDVDKILYQFPETYEELTNYDCIVAFDPDWQSLTTEQIEHLERWVDRDSGGMIVLAGPIHTDRWIQDPRMTLIRDLYPIQFHEGISLLDESRFDARIPEPIELTSEGLREEFLWLDENATASKEAWDSFKGVYGYYRVRSPKDLATVYAHYFDIHLGRKFIYMAGQFYGGGQVFYLGSGEMWRVRSIDEGHFETFYTKLIRHVSNGHKLRGGRDGIRGLLFVDPPPYRLGGSVKVRAQFKNARDQPLKQPSISLQVRRPDGTSENLILKLATPGMYEGKFILNQNGLFHLGLKVPGTNKIMTQEIDVDELDTEIQNRQRNDALLKQLANETVGIYYVGLNPIDGDLGLPPLAGHLPDRSRTTYLIGAPDSEWEAWWMRWVLGMICGVLCLEWTIRRLLKLA